MGKPGSWGGSDDPCRVRWTLASLLARRGRIPPLGNELEVEVKMDQFAILISAARMTSIDMRHARRGLPIPDCVRAPWPDH